MVKMKIGFRVLHLMIGLFFTHASVGTIYYTTNNEYTEIWNDKHSGGNYDVSIWRLKNVETGYCSLGDVAHSSYDQPRFNSISVFYDNSNVKHPQSFYNIWTDAGSGAWKDGIVWRMVPPKGYTCLGGAAMRSNSAQPSRTSYCCIKNEYRVSANVEQTYKDTGTGAHKDLSLWTVIPTNDRAAITGHNFLAVNGYTQPEYAYLLNKNKASSSQPPR